MKLTQREKILLKFVIAPRMKKVKIKFDIRPKVCYIVV